MLELGAYTVELFKERKNTLENKINTKQKKRHLAKETEAMKIEQYKKLSHNYKMQLIYIGKALQKKKTKY